MSLFDEIVIMSLRGESVFDIAGTLDLDVSWVRECITAYEDMSDEAKDEFKVNFARELNEGI